MTTTAETERAAILDRVAAAIWAAPDNKHWMDWDTAKAACVNPSVHPQLAHQVETTQREARAAVEALIIGSSPRTGDERIANAGAHVSGLSPVACAETFDAMLSEVLA